MNEILTFNSPDCLTCATNHCQDKIDRCSNIEGAALGGPSKGKPKSQLCADTLSCSIKGRCITEDTAMRCYCGNSGGNCLGPNKANGSCKAALESGLETTDTGKIAVDFANENLGGGVAMSLALCLIANNCTMCF